MCCNHGKIDLPAPLAPPEFFRYLFASPEPQAEDFRDNIRQYNAALAFTSLGVKIDDHLNNGWSEPVFRIHGELRHRHGSLLPQERQDPAYAQLYIYDPRDALNQRMQRNSNLRRDTMECLQGILNTSHHYAHVYKHAYEVLAGRGDIEDVVIHQCRYNLPTADEMAVILPGDGSEDVGKCDIILRHRNGPLQRISEGNAAYSCLHYVLFYPYGSNPC
ncbi:hypothetical protein BKA93DRAFT_819615 [Sparassis latifolia]